MTARRGARAALAIAALAVVPAFACGRGDGGPVQVPGKPAGTFKSAATVRAARRAYDGAPPVIPHAPFGAACGSCHGEAGLEVPGVGYSPPSPHAKTAGMGVAIRCQQCHVFAETQEIFRPNAFEGLPQDLRRGTRLHEFAAPVIPHPVFLRENCLACHSGPAAREEIRTTHPERARCQQCHVETTEVGEFAR